MMPPKKNVRWTTETLMQGVWKKVAAQNKNRASFFILPGVDMLSNPQLLVSIDPSFKTVFSFVSFINTTLGYTIFPLPVGGEAVYMMTNIFGGASIIICEETYDEE